MDIHTKYDINDRVFCIKQKPEYIEFEGTIVAISYLFTLTDTEDTKDQITYVIKTTNHLYKVNECDIIKILK